MLLAPSTHGGGGAALCQGLCGHYGGGTGGGGGGTQNFLGDRLASCIPAETCGSPKCKGFESLLFWLPWAGVC